MADQPAFVKELKVDSKDLEKELAAAS